MIRANRICDRRREVSMPRILWLGRAVATTCLALILSRFVWPDLKVDDITVWLAAIGSIWLLAPEPTRVAQFVKSFKIGPTGLEGELDNEAIRDHFKSN